MSEVVVKLTERQALGLLEALDMGLEEWTQDQEARPDDMFGSLGLRWAKQARNKLMSALPKEEE